MIGEQCTLRAAIQEANATTGADTINFNIPGTGVHTIAPASELPKITGPVTINGYSQPGAKPNALAVGSDAVLKVELSGGKFFGANGLLIGASNSTVKGLVINDWFGTGITISGATATGNSVLQNSTFSNGEEGIDLGGDGPTANDAGDPDTGPNNLQNRPDITSAKTGSLKTTIKGSLNSTPNKTFTVCLFSNPPGTDEGKVFIGTTSVPTDASGNATFTFSPNDKVGLGRTITATATDSGGNTSEFSAPRTVASP